MRTRRSISVILSIFFLLLAISVASAVHSIYFDRYPNATELADCVFGPRFQAKTSGNLLRSYGLFFIGINHCLASPDDPSKVYSWYTERGWTDFRSNFFPSFDIKIVDVCINFGKYFAQNYEDPKMFHQRKWFKIFRGSGC